MAEFTIPPAFEPLVDACGDAALPAFEAADFANDPGAAFSEGMSAAMDVMADAGMPAPMMEMMQDFCSGAFEQHMAGGGDPMDAFDAVGSAIDGLMAPFPNDMPCSEMAADFPPMPPDMGAFMDGCPPYGDFPGGETFDAAAMPDTWEPGPMTDMGPPPGDMGPPPGDMGPGPDGPAFGPDGEPMGPPPGEAPNPDGGFGPGPDGPMGPPPGDMGPGGPGDMPPPGDMGPGGPPPGDFGGDGPGGAQPGDMGPGPEGPMGPPPGADMDGDGMPPPMGPDTAGGPDPLFGEGGPAGGPPPGDMGPPPGDMGDHMGPPPGDMGPGGPPPGGPDPMAGMEADMADAGHHHGPAEGPGPEGPPPGDMPPGDMPPPPEDDPNAGGDGM
ncbi:MAG: hypothetical protein CMM90_05030 [Rickettsiales bacterium]|nr:hypothetical protein [Rickettsiales bacterium]